MVVESHGSVSGGTFLAGDFQSFANGLLGHRRVGAQCDQNIQGGYRRGPLGMEGLEDGSDRGGAGAIGDDE